MGRIDWIEIEHLPEHLKDGRDLLLWLNLRFAHVYRWDGRRWHDGVLPLNMAYPTHFAEINAP